MASCRTDCGVTASPTRFESATAPCIQRRLRSCFFSSYRLCPFRDLRVYHLGYFLQRHKRRRVAPGCGWHVFQSVDSTECASPKVELRRDDNQVKAVSTVLGKTRMKLCHGPGKAETCDRTRSLGSHLALLFGYARAVQRPQGDLPRALGSAGGGHVTRCDIDRLPSISRREPVADRHRASCLPPHPVSLDPANRRAGNQKACLGDVSTIYQCGARQMGD